MVLPPCSAFSIAGRRERKVGIQEKLYSDGKKVENIEDLFFEFTRITGDIMDYKVVIGENVGLDLSQWVRPQNIEIEL